MLSYDDLVSFAAGHVNDPVELAKSLVAWEWTSWHAFGVEGIRASDVHDLNSTLYGACGWRNALFESIFEDLGFQTRTVCLPDVPIQGGHVASEVFINGKWMFFDATFGLFFEARGGGDPLSVEEVRAQWSNVEIKGCTLPGWQGQMADPAAIDVGQTFKTLTDPYALHPGFPADMGVLGGELESVYVSPGLYVIDSGTQIRVGAGERSWATAYDTTNSAPWISLRDYFDDLGRLDTRILEMDDGHRTFLSFDPGNHYDWQQISVDVRNNFYIDRVVIEKDGGSRTVTVYDARGAPDFDPENHYPWLSRTLYYTSWGALERETGVFDDGSTWATSYDPGQAPDPEVTDPNPPSLALSSYKVLIGSTLTATLVPGAAPVGSPHFQWERSWDGETWSSIELDQDSYAPSENEGGAILRVRVNYADELGISYSLASSEATVVDPIPHNEHLTGTDRLDVLYGHAGNDTAEGLEGNDLLYGGEGNNQLCGGDGDDFLQAGAGDDLLDGGAGKDQL
jgi:hypothetical protein